ncbi:MAG: bifunctional folylpolyglutamate synthase/dihydrofolate synthase, partial [Flavobacteriales bacterium]
MEFQRIEDVMNFLYSQLPAFHRVGPAAYKPGLDNTYALMDVVGNPHKDFKTIHIAGTNGKGSTSHLVASALQQAGYRTGLYTSPHLIHFGERIRINGKMIDDASVMEFVNTYHSKWESIHPSFFEITVALCFWYFKKEKVDIAVIETGLGGRLDSTNIIEPEVAAITSIGMDHMQFLGNTIESIATEKAGIIKSGHSIVTGELPLDALEVIRKMAEQKEVKHIHAPDQIFDIPLCALKGKYQRHNLRTAYAILNEMQLLGWKMDHEKISAGFIGVVENTGIRGRWETLQTHPRIIADVAHNEEGIREVVQQLNETEYRELHFVLGLVADKDIEHVLKSLPVSAKYYFTKAQLPRAMDPELLMERASQHQLLGRTFTNVSEALDAAMAVCSTDDLIFIGGS